MSSKSLLTAEEIHASATEGATGNSDKTMDSTAAESAEAHVLITARAGGDFDFNLQSSVDGGTTWVTIKTVAGVAAIGPQVLVAGRGDEALGTLLRVAWTRNAGTMTFSIILGIKE